MISPRTFRSIRIVIWALPIVLFLWIVSANLLPSGRVTYRCTATRCDPQIENFASKEPEELIGTTKDDARERYRRISADPLYFDVRLFRPMRRATIRLTYQNPENQPRLRLGIVGKGIGFAFTDFADHHPLLQELAAAPDWETIREGDTVLFQRRRADVRRFATLAALSSDLPDPARIAVHKLDLTALLPIPDAPPAAADPRPLLSSLRGAHEFWAYVRDGETLDVRLTIVDPNVAAGPDEVAFQVLRDQELVATSILPDDGVDRETKRASPSRDHRIVVPNLTRGIYRVEVLTKGEPVVLTSVSTTQRFVVVPKNLQLDRVAQPTKVLLARGTTVTAFLTDAEAAQTLTVGGQRVRLTDRRTEARLDLKGLQEPFVEVTVPRGGVRLESDGYFVAAPDQFIPTLAIKFDPLPSRAPLEQYDYVVARYPQVGTDGTWRIAEKTIEDLPQARKVSFFIVGDPALGETKKALRVRDLSVTLEGEPLTVNLLITLGKKFLENVRSGIL